MELCKYCKQEITPEYRAVIRQRKVQNALNSVAKREANGNSPGPKRIVSIELVCKLRAEGKSFRKIAKQLGYSPTAIYAAYKKSI